MKTLRLTSFAKKEEKIKLSKIDFEKYNIRHKCFDKTVIVRAIKDFELIVLSNLKNVKIEKGKDYLIPVRDAVVLARKGVVEDREVCKEWLKGSYLEEKDLADKDQ